MIGSETQSSHLIAYLMIFAHRISHSLNPLRLTHRHSRSKASLQSSSLSANIAPIRFFFRFHRFRVFFLILTIKNFLSMF
ncbi:hypothetical protein RJT34_24290 [Clitoria ternatea]|uniref:Uncharacterized protein n=1 Tax=Clitoria ternatea TaxID=43366 RepID=A0AAN9FPD7_CLITE